MKQTGCTLAKLVKRVLIYRLGSLGDMLVALPALHLVARAFPNAERRMLTNLPVSAKAPSAAAILDNTGLLHGYLSYPVGTRSLWQLFRLWLELVRWRPQVVVYLAAARGIDVARRDAVFFRCAGIAQQIGVPLTEEMQRNLPEGLDGPLEPEAARLVRNLGMLGEGRLDDPENWSLRLTLQESAHARRVLEPAGGRRILTVCIGTKMQAKDWGRENWRQLLVQLGRLHPGCALALCGALDEEEVSEYVAKGWPGPVINLCGRLTPRESAAVIAECQLFLGHDSGPMHLAAAVQTPSVAIFAARNKPRVWFPHGLKHRVIYHSVDCWGCGLETCIAERKRCITSITIAEVLAAIEEQLMRS